MQASMQASTLHGALHAGARVKITRSLLLWRRDRPQGEGPFSSSSSSSQEGGVGEGLGSSSTTSGNGTAGGRKWYGSSGSSSSGRAIDDIKRGTGAADADSQFQGTQSSFFNNKGGNNQQWKKSDVGRALVDLGAGLNFDMDRGRVEPVLRLKVHDWLSIKVGVVAVGVKAVYISILTSLMGV